MDVANAGDYRLKLRFATRKTGRRLHVEFDGVDATGQITLPFTGGLQSWQRLTLPVTLNAGPQVMRIKFDTGGMNLNWVRLVAK